MALYSMKEILGDAQKNGYGVGFYNAVNMEMVRAYMRAAEDQRSPIIIGTAEGLLGYASLDWIAPLLLDGARRAKVPVAVHLDHAYSFDVIMQALRAGFGSVMFDGSALSYEDNVRISADVARIAHPMGVDLECELGKVGGFEEGEGVRGGNVYTDPRQAADFTERTGVDFLAISIGTMHGVYTAAPKLDLGRLAEVRAAVDKPLVLHGGSGLSTEDFRSCIKGGICKVNIYTDVITGGVARTRAVAGDYNYTDLCQQAEQAMYDVTVEKIKIFGSSGRA